MLLSGFARPKARWPFGLFRSVPAHVLHGLERPFEGLPGQPTPATGDGQPEAEAHAFYCGRFSFAGETVAASPEDLFTLSHPSAAWREERDGLAWLRYFCLSPRRLHVYYLARLIENWMKYQRSRTNLAVETRRLNHLAQALPSVAKLAGPHEQKIFRQALHAQSAHLLHLKADTALEAAFRAMSILALVSRDQSFSHLAGGAWAQLAASLPLLLHPDGSDIWGNADRAIEIAGSLGTLLASGTCGTAPPAVVASCDRLFAYLAMFRFGPDVWSSDVAANVPEVLEKLIEDRPPMGHAPQGGRTLLQQADTRLLAHWSKGLRLSLLEIVHKGRPLLCIRQGGNAADFPSFSAEREMEPGQGELLCMSWSGGGVSWERSVYLAADGKDIRVEDAWQGDFSSCAIEIAMPPRSRVLKSRDGAEASLYPPDGPALKVKVRGGAIAGGEAPNSLTITGTHGQSGCVQWALKLHKPPKTRGGRSQRKSYGESELPF